MTDKCPVCNELHRPQARFCSACGTPLYKDESEADLTSFQTLQPGTTIQEQYRIQRQLGEGGLGRVFLAEDASGRRFAIKQIREFRSEQDRYEYELYLHSFQREAKILSSLPHPYLPIARDFIITPNSFLIVMDYIEGRTLSQVLEESPEPISEERVLKWGIQICEALSYLHRKKPPIIHRNIKPKNIILQADGPDERVRLIGFGLARFYQEGLEHDEDQLGTPGYSPPEQYGVSQTDARSDIYSLGATMYTLLTKYDLETQTQTVLLSKPSGEFVDIRERNESLSRATNEVVMKALQQSPEDRFLSAEEMQVALETILFNRQQLDQIAHFILDQPVTLEETRYCEFKEIKGDDPTLAIKRMIEDYVVAFLNSEGGRIFWGIRDHDRVVVGVKADYPLRDQIRRLITDKVMRIQPAISPSAFRVTFHPIHHKECISSDLFVIEVAVSPALTDFLYFTSDNRVIIKTDAGKKQLSGPEIQDEIIRRLQRGEGQKITKELE